ncbi:MAG: TetR/AcrR family transcriptional regulator [Proteobacteria bacterium]|nr:MAG: TetR/AcrR family transcriptional regulator [Pseudomonadota bacterium]
MPKRARSLEKIRDLERSRREILSAAFTEIHARGFQGVSVDDIVLKTSLTKGAFYHAFPTKLDLGYALVEEVISPMILNRWIRPLEAFENPIDGIIDRLKTLIGNAPQAHLRLGCPLNNLVQEMAPLDAGFRRRLKSALKLWVAGVGAALERGQSAGFVRSDLDTSQSASFIVMAHEGFYGLLKGLGDAGHFGALFAPLEMYLDTLRVRNAQNRPLTP